MTYMAIKVMKVETANIVIDEVLSLIFCHKNVSFAKNVSYAWLQV